MSGDDTERNDDVFDRRFAVQALVVCSVVAGAVVAFVGGMKYEESRTVTPEPVVITTPVSDPGGAFCFGSNSVLTQDNVYEYDRVRHCFRETDQ